MTRSSPPSQPTQARPGPIVGDIDVFRGIAALTVAAFHTREITWIGISSFWHQYGLQAAPNVVVGYLTFPLVWGSIGVPIFFVLSGYCIHRTQAFARTGKNTFKFSPTNFLIRRFFRIYPVLFGALLVTLLCDTLSRHYFPNSYKLGDTSIGAFVANLLSLQGIVSKPYGSNIALWTLSIEVQFYLVYPILLVLMFRLGKLKTLWLLTIINVISYFTLERYGYQVFLSYYVSWYLGALIAECEAAGFFAGQLASTKIRVVVTACSLLLLSAGCVLYFRSQYLGFQIWAVAFSAFLFATLSRRTMVAGRMAQTFRWFGSFSFSIYIIHVPVVVLVHSIVYNSEHQTSIAPFFEALFIAVLCAYAFSFAAERPALALSHLFKHKSRTLDSRAHLTTPSSLNAD
jgi:peptidoglycan/LPS O-acetylase OafA/YrhL